MTSTGAGQPWLSRPAVKCRPSVATLHRPAHRPARALSPGARRAGSSSARRIATCQRHESVRERLARAGARSAAEGDRVGVVAWGGFGGWATQLLYPPSPGARLRRDGAAGGRVDPGGAARRYRGSGLRRSRGRGGAPGVRHRRRPRGQMVAPTGRKLLRRARSSVRCVRSNLPDTGTLVWVCGEIRMVMAIRTHLRERGFLHRGDDRRGGGNGYKAQSLLAPGEHRDGERRTAPGAHHGGDAAGRVRRPPV